MILYIYLVAAYILRAYALPRSRTHEVTHTHMHTNKNIGKYIHIYYIY